MGYMGLACWQDSDMAADFHSDIEECGKDAEKAVKMFAKELGNDANCYNTPGCVNIALVVEDGILDSFNKKDKKKFIPIISRAVATLDSMITERKDDKDENIVWHVTAYERMSKSLTKYIKENK
jgi:hypothetical protein